MGPAPPPGARTVGTSPRGVEAVAARVVDCARLGAMSVLRNTLSGSNNAVNDARPYVPGMVYDVIIAGAGPVGLFLACELRLAKLSVLVLEQLADPSSPLKRLP